jgi:hypothetical protein
MSQARISKLEALLARVSGRRDEPRLHVVAAPAEEPVAAAAHAPEPVELAEPVAMAAEPAIIVMPDVPAGVSVGDGAPPTPSVIDALAAIRPEALISLPPAALGADARSARGPIARPSMPAPSEPEAPELDEPEEPTVAVAVPNLLRAVHPELTPAGDPAVPEEAPPAPAAPPAVEAPAALAAEPEPAPTEPTLPEPTLPEPSEPAAPEPVLELVQPAAVSTPEPPRVSVPPPRMSLPVRPSLPSPELVPEALPFTLLTERPPALPSEQESLELAAIALSTAPVIDLGGAGPVRVEVQPLSDLIEMPEVDVARVSAAVTVVPTASSTPPSGRGPAPIIPPVLAPAITALGGSELEPDVLAPSESAAEELVGDAIRAQLPSITGSAVTVSSPLPSRAPQSFGRLLSRSLALRPRS